MSGSRQTGQDEKIMREARSQRSIFTVGQVVDKTGFDANAVSKVLSRAVQRGELIRIQGRRGEYRCPENLQRQFDPTEDLKLPAIGMYMEVVALTAAGLPVLKSEDGVGYIGHPIRGDK